MHRPGVELATFRSQVRLPNHYTTEEQAGLLGDINIILIHVDGKVTSDVHTENEARFFLPFNDRPPLQEASTSE